MRIGLVRHYKVNISPKKYMNSNEFIEYITEYDRSEVTASNMVINGIEWSSCYCSDMTRAIITAKNIYEGEIKVEPLLREVSMLPIFDLNMRFPKFLWSLTSRTAWLINHKSQPETRILTKARVEDFLKLINEEENILIVSHGFFLISLINSLKKKGFKGNTPVKLKNGELYILERE